MELPEPKQLDDARSASPSGLACARPLIFCARKGNALSSAFLPAAGCQMCRLLGNLVRTGVTVMMRYDLLLLAVALIPLAMAVLFRVAIVPRRQSNMSDLLQLALRRADGEEQTEQRSYLRQGQDRVQRDFESLYTLRLLAPSVLNSFLYAIAIPLAFASVLPGHDCTDWLLAIPQRFPPLASYDFLLYAVIGAYTFNLGMLVRRMYLIDVTEHVYWGAINRLLLTCGLALAVHGGSEVFGISADKPFAQAGYFIIAFIPGVFLTVLKKWARKRLQDDGKVADELPIQMVQGIDIWKEERLEEEGIESVQNLATADVLSLAVKTHYPMRTLIDWIDQAIIILRFPEKIGDLRNSGFPVSAIDFAWMSPANNDGSKELAGKVAEAISLNPDIVAVAMDSWFQDSYVKILWSLWQNEGHDISRPTM
jgi:hypothetical protein